MTTTTETGPTPGPSLARSTAVMTLGTVISRVTGVVRLAIIVAALGVAETRLPDAYNLANSVPNIIYELVLGGVIGAVFVPLFVELLEKEDRARAWEVISGILNLSLASLALIALIGIVAAPSIAGFYATRLGGAEAALQRDVITFLLRLFIPQVVLYGLYFVGAAIMNAHKRFGPPMFTPILNNVVIIVVFAYFWAVYGTVTLRSVTTGQLLLIGLGTTLSVAPMGLGLIPYLRKLGRYRLTFAVDHPAVRKLARLGIFVVGFVVANQIGFIVIQWLANEQQGAFTAYTAAFTFFLLPVGLFVWSISTALLPAFSEHAVNKRWDEYRAAVSTGLRAILFLMLPAAAGYVVLAEPLVRVLLQHGVVTSSSTQLVAGVLRFLTLGLVQFAVFQLLVRALYALQDTKTPFVVNCFVVALNLAINVPMFQWLGVEGLGVGHAAAYTFGTVATLIALHRRVDKLPLRDVGDALFRSLCAASGMALLVWFTWKGVGESLGSSLMGSAMALLLCVAVGGLGYVVLAYLLRMRELDFVRSTLVRRGRGTLGT